MAERTRGSAFTDGSISAHILRLSGYVAMGFLAMTSAQLIEAVYLGMVGSDELAAIAFTFPVVMALNAMTRGIGVGTGAVLARSIGAGQRDHAARVASHGLLLTVVFTLVCSVLIASWRHELFALIGARDHILELTVAYMAIWAIGFPAFGLSMVGAGLMRSFGDPAFPGLVMATGALAQIAIGPPLIFGWFGLPALGIEGAAWSFVASRTVSLFLTAWWFGFRERMIRRTLVQLGDSTRTILRVGVPASASNLIQPVSTGVITWLLASHGSSVVAGFGVASRIEAVVNMVVIAIAASAAPMVGQNWGARLYDRVDAALSIAHRYCLVWGVSAACIMWAGAALFARLISDDAEVARVATLYLYIVPISIGFTGMTNVANGSFNALNKPLPPLLLSLLRTLIVYVPLAIAASTLFGFEAVFVVTALVNVVFGVVGWGWNRRLVAVLKRRRIAAP